MLSRVTGSYEKPSWLPCLSGHDFLAEKYFASWRYGPFSREPAVLKSKDVRCQHIPKNVHCSKKDLKIHLAVLSLKKNRLKKFWAKNSHAGTRSWVLWTSINEWPFSEAVHCFFLSGEHDPGAEDREDRGHHRGGQPEPAAGWGELPHLLSRT